MSISNDTLFLSDGGFVRLPDGSDTNELQLFEVSILADTLFVSNGNFVIISGITTANYTVQERLDAGATPCELVEDGVALSELIGKQYAGGLIFYLEGDGCSGMVASLSDQTTAAEWGCFGTFISGANGFSIGTGAQNTIDILNGCAESGIAAEVADDFDDGTFSDWFLPSRAELSTMYSNLKVNNLGGFSNALYWSSSESQSSSGRAWAVNFTNGSFFEEFKDLGRSVRAARTFSNE